MSEAADAKREEIRALCARRARGDVPDRAFQKQLTEASVALTRAVASSRLDKGESFVAESHEVHSHLKLAQSVLQEPEQVTVSLYVSPRRLVRVRGVTLPGRPVTCDASDGTTIDELPLREVARVVPRKQVRWGEAATGLAVMVLALALGKLLQITGPLLVLLGLAGLLHALLLPTRWIEIVPRGPAPAPPFELHSLRQRSTRAVLAAIREAMADTARQEDETP